MAIAFPLYSSYTCDGTGIIEQENPALKMPPFTGFPEPLCKGFRFTAARS